MAKVYFTKEITPESLQKIYEALGVKLSGKIGVKVSTGERGAKGYLKADLIGPFVKALNGTIVECNTAYEGARNTVKDHLEVAKEHGFTSFADVDIMDAKGEIKIPVHKGKHLKYDLLGSHFDDYDAYVNLAHGKGHVMGGFGANLKNHQSGLRREMERHIFIRAERLRIRMNVGNVNMNKLILLNRWRRRRRQSRII